MKSFLRFLAVCLIGSIAVFSAHAQLNTEAYFKYLDEHKNMKAQDLLLEYPAGVFAATAPTDLTHADFFSAIDAKYKFTDYEKELAAKNSFMVTERLSFPTYAVAFADAYMKDLPLYISSDAILHALHRSYDNMLADIEKYSLEPQLYKALLAMKATLKTSPLPKDSLAQKARNDADIYLTTALQLIKTDIPYTRMNYSTDATFPENNAAIKELLLNIYAEKLTQYSIFGTTPRDIDFSQMKPRGHYVDKGLSGYFQAMMWLGRTEIYLTKPNGAVVEPTDEDIKRQYMLAVILAELSEISKAKEQFQSIDVLITKFVGEQDNLSLTKLIGVKAKLNITSPDQLRDDALQQRFQDEAIKQGAAQQILSQLLYADPFDLNSIKPAAAFMLMGQRFIFDSYILGNVIFDKVQERMMPSPLDAMFVLGNDASIQLLKPELERYDYAKNLAGLRYLSSTFDKSYWESSLYSTWLSGIRSLNPPLNRTSLPRFMQTSAWWQKSLNTQLGSWAELRHDNLLYAKQSYTPGSRCFYPIGFVEPIPILYSTIQKFSKNMKSALKEISVDDRIFSQNKYGIFDSMRVCLDHITTTCKFLSSMAEKELRGESFSLQEQELISNWIQKKQIPNCVPTFVYNGIFPRMMYGEREDEMDNPNYLIADVHTQPTDLAGNLVGKVLHVGTGKINMALIIAQDPADGCSTAYVGPVGSYYEHITDDFKRLSDEDWNTLKISSLPRPAWVNSYLASNNGDSKGEAQTLFLGGVAEQPIIPSSTINATFSPNPTSSSSLLTFVVPLALSEKNITIKVYSSNGEFVRELTYSSSGNGKFTSQWNGLNSKGEAVGSGVYLVHISLGESAAVVQCTVTR